MRMGRRVCGFLAALLMSVSMVSVSAKENYMYDVGDGEKAPFAEDDSVWAPTAAAVSEAALSIGGKSAVLMEQESGQILFEKNSHEKLPIASVTKVMTLLLTMEAIDGGLISYTDTVTCSKKAASMGGSQIWLEEGEQMTVDHLLKAAAVVSANDACAMLAEHICGTIENFVNRMNERAAELGMKDTNFLDCSGLNDEGVSSAHDVAVMSRELMKHKDIQKYTTIWMDTLRDGTSQLVNTNKLVRHYNGSTGLKTGTTAAAGHCLSATAERNGISFVAVILGCENTDERFGGARAMLDYGFAGYTLYRPQGKDETPVSIRVKKGMVGTVDVTAGEGSPILLKKGQEKNMTVQTELAEDVTAPVEKGQVVGTKRFLLGDEVIAEIPIRTVAAVEKITVWRAFTRLIDNLTK